MRTHAHAHLFSAIDSPDANVYKYSVEIPGGLKPFQQEIGKQQRRSRLTLLKCINCGKQLPHPSGSTA